MTTYKHRRFEEIWKEILITLLDKVDPQLTHLITGRGDKKFVEEIGVTFELTDPRNRFVWNATRDTNYEFAMKMWIWIINGCDDFAYVGGSNVNAQKFIDASTVQELEKATFNTAYGPRIYAQLDDVLSELLRDRGTRRATINILDKDDKVLLSQDTKTEFPCIETITFLIRDNELHCHVNARSNNMYTTVVYDVFVFTMLQEYVYEWLRRNGYDSLNLGHYYHHITSAHLFIEDVEKAEAAINDLEVAMTRPEVKV